MANDNSIALLHATLSRRETPETVAELVGQASPPRLTRHIRVLLQARLAALIERLSISAE